MASLRRVAAPSLLLLAVVAWLAFFLHPVDAGLNIDGGRSQLPGMKQDMFDQAQRQKDSKGAHARMGKGPPDCPKSDKMSPFLGLAFVAGDMYVKTNSSEEKCSKLLTVGGANFTVLSNASRTCGPAGEWKKRVAEELSAVFFQAGLDWVKHEGDEIEVVTEDGTFVVPVNEARYAEMSECWAKGCDCEQAKNPMGRAVLFTLLALAVAGLGWDSIKLGIKQIWGEKPSKHVLCKNGHPMEKVQIAPRHMCDLCGKSGTSYACKSGCPYDLCESCYKECKKKAKLQLEEWYKKHPDDREKDGAKRKAKKEKKEGSDDDVEAKESKADSEAESTTKADSRAESEGKPESSKEDGEAKGAEEPDNES